MERNAPAAAGPRLQTARLELSPHTAADFEDSLAMWRDPATTRLMTVKPVGREEAWARLLRYAGLWPLVGYGYWVVRDRGSGRFVGEVGLADFRRELEPSIDGAPEAGWVLAPWAHGHGFATEAVTAALDWADRQLSAARIVCMIGTENVPSFRVAEKCGFRRYAEATYKDARTILLERPRAV